MAGHRLPFRQGYTTRVMQGYHGFATHKDDMAYAVDFDCEPGTPVVATRAARVWAVRKDSSTGCADVSCQDDANFAILDHGDGTYSEYYHLDFQGVTVRTGELVCAGQVIGLCGNTGMSTGPHLHYALTDAARHTLPVPYEELRGRPGSGHVTPGGRYTSQNAREVACGPLGYSQLGTHAFSHHGVVLDGPVQTVVSAQDGGQATVSGRYLGDQERIAVHRKPIGAGGWRVDCLLPGVGGRFEAALDWGPRGLGPGYYWLMITGANAKCEAMGWAWSYRVRVDAPASDNAETRDAPLKPPGL